ncbi:hypothetical protein FB550_11728 [Neobacillus bataviensis]|uniref:DUF3396 domain-containing protein n=1 Tax=Neobacillus bataviensis TaxID=220685 RepID=A0A561CMJ1_9BACI|nr:hypothetical protein [Neobacillus bataviensis]TWD92475.1 hypothetical protein FB550_11728 [Neobacillus bataviensis]
MKPDLFSITMYPTVSINKDEILDQLLNVFESNGKFAPTHWGNSEIVKVEYNRNEIIERVVSDSNITEIYLYRDKDVKYLGSFEVNWSPRSFLKLEFHKSIPKKLWPVFFELSDKIAEIVKPCYGVTHIFWPSAYPWNTERERLNMWMDLCANPVPVRFLPNGPLGVGVRTYISSHIMEMFGKEFLLNSPGVVSELNWNGIRIDLLSEPWKADNETLLDSWLRVMEYLESSNVMAIPDFDDDHMGVSFSPNIAWKEYLKH